MIAAKQHLREEVKAVVQAAKSNNVEQEFRAFHQRREQQIIEYKAQQAKLRLEQQEQDERDAYDQRVWRIQFYGQHSIEQYEELAKGNETTKRQARNEALLERTFDEWEHREGARTKLQVEIADPDPSVGLPGMGLGIFGVNQTETDRVALMQKRGRVEKDPMEEELLLEHHDDEDNTTTVAGVDAGSGTKQRVEVVPKEEWFLEEVDQIEHHVFDTPSYPEYELAHDDNMVIQSDLIKNQELYEALIENKSNLINSIEKLYNMKEKLEYDQHQVNQEILQIEKAQLGPPRRLPMAAEIPAMDSWKIQNAQLYKKINEILYVIEITENKKKILENQIIPLSKTIAILQEKQKESNNTINNINNNDLGQLPIIIGKNISKISGLNITAKPLETYNAITNKSKLITYKDQSNIAINLHKNINQIESNMWLTRLDESSKKADLERIINRITNISTRLQSANINMIRKNIIDSLIGFFHSNLKLKKVYTKLVGILPWYKYYLPKLSSNIIQYIAKTAMGGISFELENEIDNSDALSSGVTLGEANTGYCSGIIQLPKDSLWNIIITISRQGQSEEYNSGSSNDYISVNIGNTITSLNPIGIYYNRTNPNTGTVLYDIKYLYRGKSFAYRFDFYSISNNSKTHLAISTGMYEEYEVKDLEVISDPKLIGRTRVLSSYVKILKLNEQSGKTRDIRLLEELISVEAPSDHSYWDSNIMNNISQRYLNKKFFINIIKAEILLYQEILKLKRKKEYEDNIQLKEIMSDIAIQKEANLEESKKKYLLLKKSKQYYKIDAAKDLINKRIILWDHIENTWRNLIILDIIINWIENNTIVYILYKIQEYDDSNEKIGNIKEINLLLYKYYISPIQEYDEETILRNKERKKYELLINNIIEKSKNDILLLKYNLQKFRKKHEKLFKIMKKRIWETYNKNINNNSIQACNTNIGKKTIKNLLTTVYLDIKKGIIKIKENENKKEIAKIIAKQRYIDIYKENQKNLIINEINNKEIEMNEILNKEFEEYDHNRRKILIKAKHEKEELQGFIRKQIAERKAVLLRRVKFPKSVFKQVGILYV